MKLLTAQLNKYEIRLYFIIWISSVLYSLYQVFLAGDDFFHYGGDFIEGWAWIGRKRDNYDYEWRIWIDFIKRIIPWVSGQLVISLLFKYMRIHRTVIYGWYIIVTGTFLWNYCGIGGILYLLITPCTVCLLTAVQSKSLVYIVHIIVLMAVQFSPTISRLLSSLTNVDSTTEFMLSLAFFWLQLKGVNCCIDNINDYKHKNVLGFLQNVIQCTAYCWYLPNFFLGPHILYHKFIESVGEPAEKWTSRRMIMHLLNFVRFALWIFLTEFMLHFLYSTALSYQPRAVEKLNAWAFYGMGYCMGQYFCNKYIILYGIAGEISRMDDMDAPPPPKCIGRIHLYSDMWKYFDRGLYEFLIRCIYAPICSFNIPLKKFAASIVTFSFIYVWHGVHKFVLIWTVLNFMGVVVESIANSIGNSAVYMKWQQKLLSPQNTRRFNCMLATPLLAMSAVSNFYFFGGELIGHLYAYRLFHDPTAVVFTLMLILYCCCQVSTEMRLIESRRAIKNRCNESIDKKFH